MASFIHVSHKNTVCIPLFPQNCHMHRHFTVLDRITLTIFGITTSPIETKVKIINSENVLSLHDVSTIFSLFTVSLQLSLPPQYLHNFVSVHIFSIIFPLRKMPPQFSLHVQFSPQPLPLHNILTTFFQRTISQKNICLRNSWGNCHFSFCLSVLFFRIAYSQAFGTLQLECFRYEPGSNTEFRNLKNYSTECLARSQYRNLSSRIVFVH